jgi:mono/diheme cytochrome c family protein
LAAAIITSAIGCATTGISTPDGQALFARHCASCHGRFGEGDGPVAAVMSVPNLRTLSTRSGGTFPRDAVMRYIDGRDPPAAHGQRLMPVWGETFAGADAADGPIAAITTFVAELQN